MVLFRCAYLLDVYSYLHEKILAFSNSLDEEYSSLRTLLSK